MVSNSRSEFELELSPAQCQPTEEQTQRPQLNFGTVINEIKLVSYDDILEKLGQMGKFQLRTFLWLCLPALFPGIVIMSYTFTGAIPDYRYKIVHNICISIQRNFHILNRRCFVYGCDENKTQMSFFNVLSPVKWMNLTISSDAAQNEPSTQQCFPHNISGFQQCSMDNPYGRLADREKCDIWIYDTSVHNSTIVSDVSENRKNQSRTVFFHNYNI